MNLGVKRCICLILCTVLFILAFYANTMLGEPQLALIFNETRDEEGYIKWVDFTVTCGVLEKVINDRVKWNGTAECYCDWLDILAYLGTKYGGDFSRFKQKDLDALHERLHGGETIESITEGMKHFAYFREAYDAVLSAFLGDFSIEVEREDGTVEWEDRYGLKVFSPIAKTYPFSHYDDFGVSRSYGYKRKHLGHDLMAAVGTPVVAVESGYVEELGWNQYGGWRIGIRSFDQKRYYYYAHFRQNYPYPEGLAKGDVITAGDVIGYVGRTGYSAKENVNGITQSHLHFGIQLIFDESQKEGTNQIWIDPYEIVKFLERNKARVIKIEGTKDYKRVLQMKDPAVDEYKASLNTE